MNLPSRQTLEGRSRGRDVGSILLIVVKCAVGQPMSPITSMHGLSPEDLANALYLSKNRAYDAES